MLFLKTLEEPPAHAIFILATTENIRLFLPFYQDVRFMISKESPSKIYRNILEKLPKKKA